MGFQLLPTALTDRCFMVSVPQVGEAPFEWYHSSAHGLPASLNWQGTIRRTDELQRRAFTTAQPARARRSLVAAFIAVSAVIFLAYLCSMYTGKIIAASSSSRRLGTGLRGDECDNSDSSSAESPSGTSTEGRAAMPTQLAFAVGGLHAQQGNTQPTAPGETVTWAPDQMLPGTATPPLGAQRRLIGLKGKGERQGKVEEGAKRLRLEPLTEETQLQHTPPPLDPDVDLLIDSVLSEVNVLFSDDVWILDDEPPHPPGDLSPGGRHPALGGSVDWSHADTVSGEGPSSPSIFPSYRTEPEEQTDNGLPLPPVSSGRHARRGLASGVAGLHRGPPGLAAEVTREPPQAPTAGTLVRRKGVPTSSEQLVADTLPSSSRASPFTPELASAPTPFLNSASVEQTASAADLPSDAIITWLAGSFSGVPHNILRMHPFYRHPKYQPGLNTRSFNAPLATSPASARRNPNSELAKCRDIMRKVSLTPQDLEELLIQAERLCAYATTKMPVKYRRGQAGYAIDTLGTIFLVLDTLHCAAEVLGDKSSKQLWWPLVVRHIESAKFVPKKELPTTDRHFRNSKVARALNTALDYYRRGVRPPAVMVIGLKEALLCEPFPYSKFQDQQWNTWRNDAANFRRSIQLTLAGRK